MKKLKNFQIFFPEYITHTAHESESYVGEREVMRWEFPNGYGASIVCHNGTYAGEPEFAVVGPSGKLVYDTGITEDVIPCIKPHEAIIRLAQVKRLQAKKEEVCLEEEPIGI